MDRTLDLCQFVDSSIIGIKMSQQTPIRMELDFVKYVETLSTLIDEKLYNKPLIHVPSEKEIAKMIGQEFKNMDNVTTEYVEYAEGRPNLIIKYENLRNPEFTRKTIGFMGLSMDIHNVEPLLCGENPYTMDIDSKNQNIIRGPGTSGSQGHIAIFIQLLKHLSLNNVKLNHTVYVILTVDDHYMKSDIGTKRLIKEGRIDFLKNGPVYWMGGADTHPISGANGGMGWELAVHGKGGDSSRLQGTMNPTVY
jgi:acetylornithine deacetylase